LKEPVLIDRAVRGERAAFESLAATQRAAAYRIAMGLLDDADAAEDVAQDLLLRLATALPGFADESELKPWVYRVTVNLCRDRLRQSRRRAGDVPIESAVGLPSLSSEQPAEQAVDLERAGAAVAQALARLPGDQKEVLVLRYVAGLSYAEIARVTGSAQGTVASRVFRALKRLGEDLDPRHLEVLK
jgi:RNA polymerase sigma-70 factor (ECF subfamily)